MDHMIFSERYRDLISDKNDAAGEAFCGNFDGAVRAGMIDTLYDFSEPTVHFRSRYDSDDPEESTVLYDAAYQLFRIKNPAGYDSYISENDIDGFIKTAPVQALFDIIELQYEALSNHEKPEFQSAVNTVLNSGDVPWILHDGRMIKINAGQFEQDLKRKSLDRMQALADAAPVFQSAYDELASAMEFLSKGNPAEAVMNAEKSYESMLKILCNTDRGNADKLIEQLVAEGSLLDLPDSMKSSGFREKVLMSLPYIRNYAAAHGSGAADDTISHALADLAVNLACALDTYLIEEYRRNI